MWNGRAAGLPLGSKVYTCIWDGSFHKPTVIRPGETSSSIALPMVAEKLVFAAPRNGIFQVIMYALIPSNSHLSIINHRAIVPSSLMTEANLFSNSAMAISCLSWIGFRIPVVLQHRADSSRRTSLASLIFTVR